MSYSFLYNNANFLALGKNLFNHLYGLNTNDRIDPKTEIEIATKDSDLG